MKEDVQVAWVADLQSGQHPQGEGYLRVWNGRRQQWEYCCLGRLCEISGLGAWEERVTEGGTKYSTYLNQTSYLPIEVAEWAGINTAHHDESVQCRLGEMNDQGYSFPDIADDLPSVIAEYEEKERNIEGV